MSADASDQCSSGCHCDKGCNGSPQVPVFPESPAAAETHVLGVAPVKMHYEVSEMGFGAEGGCEGGCECGPNCKCNPCNC